VLYQININISMRYDVSFAFLSLLDIFYGEHITHAV